MERTLLMARQHGFSLVELSIVLVIVGTLLGGLMMPLSYSIEQARRGDAKRRLAEVREALLGFAAAQGRLPCPATADSAGDEAPLGGGACIQPQGYVPVRTLGINGATDARGLLLDPWNHPLRYAIATDQDNAFTTGGGAGIARVWRTVPTSDLFWICAAAGCANGASRIRTIPAVVFSTGANGSASTAPDELENTDGDEVFVDREYSKVPGVGFDDLVVWISPNILYSMLVTTGRLP